MTEVDEATMVAARYLRKMGYSAEDLPVDLWVITATELAVDAAVHYIESRHPTVMVNRPAPGWVQLAVGVRSGCDHGPRWRTEIGAAAILHTRRPCYDCRWVMSGCTKWGDPHEAYEELIALADKLVDMARGIS
ncbi:MAG: hypothetical protein ACRD0D_01520 [Acidimicrobiales bacterium]